MDARTVNREIALKLLSPEAARRFIRETLGVEDFDGRFAREKRTLLYEIMISWQEKIPTQSITNLSVAPEERVIPTLEQNVQSMLELEGGLCWTIHTAMHILLTSLGYDAMLLIAGVFSKDVHDHVVLGVKDVTAPGSNHIIEVNFSTVGAGEPICLDFKEESEVVQGVYRDYKYIKEGEWYVRCQKASSPEVFFPPHLVVKDGWAHVYYFKMEELTFAEVKLLVDEGAYSNAGHFLNWSLYVLLMPQQRMVFMVNEKMKVERTAGGEVEVMMLDSDDKVVAAVKKYYPTMSDERVGKAVARWSTLRKVKQEEAALNTAYI